MILFFVRGSEHRIVSTNNEFGKIDLMKSALTGISLYGQSNTNSNASRMNKFSREALELGMLIMFRDHSFLI